MYTLKIIEANGNIRLHKIGYNSYVEYTKEDAPDHNQGIKAYVFDLEHPDEVFDVSFEERGYLTENGKTVAVV